MKQAIILALIVLLSFSASAQTIYYVATNGVDNGNACTNSSTPCATIAHAISQAAGGDTISLAAGIFTEAGITIDRSVNIGGQGWRTSIIQAAVGEGQATNRILRVPGGVSCTLSNMTLRHGGQRDAHGGAILNDGSLSMYKVALTANSTYQGHGGALYNAGTATVSWCLLSGNEVYGDHSVPGVHGGGIWNGGTLTIDHSTIDHCIAGYSVEYYSGAGCGGAVFNQGYASIAFSTISSNSAGNGLRRGGSGGGIFNVGTVVVDTVTFSANQAGDSEDNSGHGGGICNTGFCQVIRSTISANVAGIGQPNLNHIGLRGYDGEGGGIYNWGVVTLSHVLVADNQPVPTPGAGPDLSGTFQSLGYNLVSDTNQWIMTGDLTGVQKGVVARLTPLGYYQGKTMSHVPLPGNPAINAGDPAFAPPPSTDQQGISRVLQGRIDIGACEFDPSHIVRRLVNDYDGDHASDFAVYNPKDARWYILSPKRQVVLAMGVDYGVGPTNCTPVLGDYDGDGIAEPATYDQRTGKWYAPYNGGPPGTWLPWQWGFPGCVPAPMDYNGDGRTELVVYDTARGNWYITDPGQQVVYALGVNWGFPGCQPVPADYDGDGLDDLAVYHPGFGMYYIFCSSGGTIFTNVGKNMIPVPGDCNLDGKDEPRVYNRTTGIWNSSCGTIQWGSPGCTTVRGDFDGNGIDDMAVYFQSSGLWYTKDSASGGSGAYWGWSDTVAVGGRN